MAQVQDRHLDIAPLTRRAWLTRVGLVVGAGLLAACTPASPPAAPQPTTAPAAPAATTAPAAAPTTAAAAKPAATTVPTTAAATKPAATTAPAAAAAGTPKRGGKVTWAVPSLPNALPSGAIAQPPSHVLMYGSLLEWDRQLKGQPALTESNQATDDKTYAFKLRQGQIPRRVRSH